MTSKFHDLNTKVRINPETYIKFDGTDLIMMQNIYGDQGISIKYDIMLILYELVDWKTIGELVAPWPPDDQQKIMSHLEMLAQSKIVVDEESAPSEAHESGLSDNLGNKIHINVENHHAMLKDYVRMAAYEKAIRNQTNENTIAMDLGCGSGVLSFFAARAGAKHIYAIERRPDIILLASELAKANGFGDKIEFIEGASSAIKESQLDPKPDLFISEILGNAILEENVLEFTLDARQRFLKPGGKMIPSQLDIYFFAYDSGLKSNTRNEIGELKDLYGFDFNLLGDVLCNKTITRTENYSPRINKAMTEPVMAKSIDFNTFDSTVFVAEFELTATQDGTVTGFCGYFKAHLDEETILTNSPWAPPTHWTQITFTLPEAKTVKEGETINMELIYDGNMRLQVKN